MAGAGILAQPVVGLANIIRLINRLPNLAGKTVLSGSSNLFIPHLHGFSTGRTVNDAVEQIVKGQELPFIIVGLRSMISRTCSHSSGDMIASWQSSIISQSSRGIMS